MYYDPRPRSHSHRPSSSKSSYSKLMREHQELEIRLFNLSKCNSRIFDSSYSLTPSRLNSPQCIRSKYSNISPTPSWLSDRLSTASPIHTPDIRPMTHRVATFNSITTPKLKFKTRAISIKPRCKQLRLKWDTNDSYVSSPSSSNDSIPDESLNSPSSSESFDEPDIKSKLQNKRRDRVIAHPPYEFPVNYIAPNYIGNGMYYPVYPPMNAYLGPYSYYSAYTYNQPPKPQKVDASIQCDNLHLIIPTVKDDSTYLRTPRTTAKSSRRASEVKLKLAEEFEVKTERVSKESSLNVLKSDIDDISCMVDKDNISTDRFGLSNSKEITGKESIPTQATKSQPWVMEFKVNTHKPNFNDRHLKMLQRLNKISNTRQSRKDKTKEELIEIRKEMLRPKHDKDAKIIEIPVSQQSNYVPTKLLARLCSGKRLKVSKKEMLSLTRRNYFNLPEVKKKIEDERKRKELIERVESAKAYKAKLKEDAKVKRLNRSVDRAKEETKL